jgi:hypothetical protein
MMRGAVRGVWSANTWSSRHCVAVCACAQLELCFTALLLLALLGIEVKDFMPDHVIGLTWLDAFVTINICIMVVTTLMSLFIIGAHRTATMHDIMRHSNHAYI